jgi:hypothetical protein
MPGVRERVIASCSFCLKPNTQVEKLVAGPGVYICGACVELCAQVIQDTPGSLPRLAPWERDMPLGDVLANLPHIAAANSQVEANLVQWVRKARSLGASWALVGESLNMTRQSAWERFSGEE